ncbi:Integrase core domain [Myroides sp. A21]|uniref:integrase catalytic domain-containing protein n=1 Tax=Myroides sp. A21 TaxID=1583100 RepID=UPI00057CD550|nr:DDE-type integrase/transposase/recombinase [Myroides sp. A21]AJA67351.1 Integrase core domain [Myroides sp. A21]
MYEYVNNVLSIPARLLYEDFGKMSYNTYKSYVQRGKLVKTREGRGKGNEAMISYYDLDDDLKAICIAQLGNPKEVVVRNKLLDFIEPDINAARFFASHRKPDGKPLSAEDQIEKTTNAIILNAIKVIIDNPKVSNSTWGKNKTNAWKNISEAVNDLVNVSQRDVTARTYKHSLPENPRRLQTKYKDYQKEGYATFIHKGEGRKNAQLIKGDIADYLIAMYAQPNKVKIPELTERYNQLADMKGWASLTESAIYRWLMEPAQERIWMLGRHSIEEYHKKYGYSLSINKEELYPNYYWSIDGTKLDWIHIWEPSTNKMGSALKVDVVIDVYSEKIIGWSLGFSENHIEHFRAVKMAVNEAQCRPYYLTYDNQSGHKSQRMQTLYNELVAKDGGFHHAHKPKETKGPVEGVFRRLQQQVINRFWFSDGQSIKVRRADNRMNVDFIHDNKAFLKTTDELVEAWQAVVNIWNNRKHPHQKKLSRNEVYQQEMDKKEPLSLVDIVDKMWIEEAKRPITYKAHGLEMWLGDHKYIYEVYDVDGNVDLEFRRVNVNKKFIVRFDPDFMDGYIQLFEKDYDGNIIFVANAEPKRKHGLHGFRKEGDNYVNDHNVKALERERDLMALAAIRYKTGITPDTLIEEQEFIIKQGGDVEKGRRAYAESRENIISLYETY